MGKVPRLKLRYSPRARREIDGILSHIRRSSPYGASSVAARLEELIARIRVFPDLGRKTEVNGVRQINANPYPYVIIYRTSEEMIEIVTVRHSAREDAHEPPS